MASEWKIKCPVHGEVIKAERMIPISMDGVSSNEPIFYCEKCGHYYIHTDAVSPDSFLDYGSKKLLIYLMNHGRKIIWKLCVQI